MIHILTDSTSDLPAELKKSLGIETIPMYVQLDGKVYKDGDDIDAATLFEAVERTGKYPTTSAPSPSDFLPFFDRKDPVIYIGVTSKLSTTFRNAQLASGQLENKKTELIDSLSISTGYGQTVEQAAIWRNQGMEFNGLCKRIRDFVTRTRGIFILDTLDYLYHGGRCSSIEHFVASILKIHPFLQILPDGTLGILRKVRGARAHAIKTLLGYFLEQVSIYKIKRIFLTHLDCDDEVEFLADEIRTHAPNIEIITAQVGCVLATHSGPRPLGIAYTIS